MKVELRGKDIPDEIQSAMQWAVFAMWQKEAGDDGLSFTQRVEISDLNGKVILKHSADFAFKKDVRSHRSSSAGAKAESSVKDQRAAAAAR